MTNEITLWDTPGFGIQKLVREERFPGRFSLRTEMSPGDGHGGKVYSTGFTVETLTQLRDAIEEMLKA